MNRILYLTIVREYYRQNAIFIFAVLMFAIGFLRGNEHLAIINEALRSPFILSCIFLLWILYALKVTLFALRFLSQRSSEFLYHIRLFSPAKRIWAFMNLQFSLIQLAFTYAVLMIGKGILEKTWWAILAIVVVNLVVVVAGALVYEYRIRRPNSRQDVTRKYANLSFTTPQFLFYPQYLLTRQTVLLLITKSFTAFVIMGVCYLYPTDDYDIRLISLGCLLAAFSQSVILQNLHFFERMYFDMYRNMPVSGLRWFLNYLLTLAVILLPEAVVLARNFPAGPGLADGVLQFVFLFSVTVVLLHYQIFVAGNNESGFQVVFFSGVLLAILVMFRIPAWAFSAAGLLLAYGMLKRRFYEVE
ncbi:hypothetical protein [Leadbetterella sp. DM7]|uniref:hypothetical protein n=1 Tax=Leadbetterella sp. DM7 TaxID=3235085 RepID=UPI00349EDF04